MCSGNLFWLLSCILVSTFTCSPMICQSFISCLCTPDQNWLHFSLSAALTISIMQSLHLQLLARQTESKSKHWIFPFSGTQCSRRCWRWAVLSFGGNSLIPKEIKTYIDTLIFLSVSDTPTSPAVAILLAPWTQSCPTDPPTGGQPSCWSCKVAIGILQKQSLYQQVHSLILLGNFPQLLQQGIFSPKLCRHERGALEHARRRNHCKTARWEVDDLCQGGWLHREYSVSLGFHLVFRLYGFWPL